MAPDVRISRPSPLTKRFCWRFLAPSFFSVDFFNEPYWIWRITSSPGALQRPSTTELVGTKMSYKLNFPFRSKENGAPFFLDLPQV
jgi:hypothetical protein